MTVAIVGNENSLFISLLLYIKVSAAGHLTPAPVRSIPYLEVQLARTFFTSQGLLKAPRQPEN
jgi:hypothetical protein